jgi:hypothetical protein
LLVGGKHRAGTAVAFGRHYDRGPGGGGTVSLVTDDDRR